MATIKARLLTILAVLSILLLGTSATGWLVLGLSNGAIQTIFGDRVVPLRDLKIVSDMYAVNIVDTAHKVRGGVLSWEKGEQSVQQALAEVGETPLYDV